MADRFSFVQYPDIRPFRRPKAPFFKHQMPFHKRMLLLMLSTAGLLFGLFLLFLLGVFVYSVLFG
jgi:hypothetical protein